MGNLKINLVVFYYFFIVKSLMTLVKKDFN